MTNDVIDRYQILEKIGAGGMGTVYLAWDREIEREVALKWLPAFFSQDQHFTERFKREARVVARLEHPHIVPIYDVGENEGRPFIIMRLLKGGTLRDQIGRAGFDLATLVKSLDEIGDALAAAHARHIIHRDIKPGNILFDEHYSAFLSDFGIAKVLDSGTQLTGSGFIGTPAYMSPEQFIGQSIDGRSDQYALAVVIYEALTGSLPFQGNTAQMMYKHINVAPPAIDLDENPIPSSLNPVLQKALAKDPSDRYARILDFTTALRIAVRQDPAASALPLAVGIGLVPTPQKPLTAPTKLDTPPEEHKTDQLQQDYREGLEAMSRSQWAVALAAFNRVLQTNPNYGNAAEFKQQAESNLSRSAAVVPASEDVTSVDPSPAAASAAVEADLEDGHNLAAAAVVGLAAAGAAAHLADSDKTGHDLRDAEAVEGPIAAPLEPVDDLEKTSLDLPAALPVEAPLAESDDLEKTSLDLPTGAVAAAAATSPALGKPSLEQPAVEPVETPLGEIDDLDKTSLDLPAAAVGAAVIGAQPDLEQTSLDLPPGAHSAGAVGAAAATPDLDSTTLDLPPLASVADPYTATSQAAPVAEEVEAPQQKKRGIPIWMIAVGIILLLLLCGGGAYAAVNLLGPTDGGEVAGEPPAGGAIAAVGGQGKTDPNSVVVATELQDTAEPEPTAEPIEATEEPSPEPVVVVENTEEPPTPTDEPTETPAPSAPIVRVNISSANLRRGPGVVYGVQQVVYENDLLEIVAKNRDASWLLVMLEDGALGWLSTTVVDLVDDANPDVVEIAATIPVAPTNTPLPPTFTPVPTPTPPPVDSGGGGGSGGGGNGGGGGGDDKPPPAYTREAP